MNLLAATEATDIGSVLFDIFVVLLAAKVAAEVAERINAPAVLGEILAGYPVYRTYLSETRRTEIDRARIASAVTAAADVRPEIDRDLLAFLEASLAFEIASEPAQDLARSAQQVTGAITAKGGRLTPPEGGSGPEYTLT